jgi:hypothetical protein
LNRAALAKCRDRSPRDNGAAGREQRHTQGIFMRKPSLTPSARLRLIRAIGCLAYPVGLGVVIGLALFIKPML